MQEQTYFLYERFWSINNFALAYRKAKADLHYSNDPLTYKLLDYEQNLKSNLEGLQKFAREFGQDSQKSKDFIKDKEFLGTFSVAAKKISVKEESNSADADTKALVNEEKIVLNESGSIHASPNVAWKKYLEKIEGRKLLTDFRIISNSSVNFHILSALWLGTVGNKIDKKLGMKSSAEEHNEYVWANRLRRSASGEYNWLSHGSFKPYLFQYKKWQDYGLQTIEKELNNNQKVVAITADVSGFYPNLDTEFFDTNFICYVLGIKLNDDEKRLHQIFYEMLQEWRKHISEEAKLPQDEETKGTQGGIGLPIGVPASGLVANAAMVEFDRFIKEEINPLYYGRYVDDIILVLKNNSVWEWIISRSGFNGKPLLECSDGSPQFVSESLKDSKIVFGNDKNNVLFLEGVTGKHLLQSLSKNIQERTSEWRALPSVPDNTEIIPISVVQATSHTNDQAVALNSAEQMTSNRSHFALLLRDYEGLARSLDKDSWVKHRQAFYSTLREYFFNLPKFFELERYMPRILQIAVVCEDWDELILILQALLQMFNSVQHLHEHQSTLNGYEVEDAYKLWRNSTTESVTRALEISGEIELDKQSQINEILLKLSDKGRELNNRYKSLFLSDLALEPLRTSYIKSAHSHFHFRLPKLNSEDIAAATDMKGYFSDRFFRLSKSAKALLMMLGERDSENPKKLDFLTSSTGFIFPTRPLRFPELLIEASNILHDDSEKAERYEDKINDTIAFFRGFSIKFQDITESEIHRPSCPQERSQSQGLETNTDERCVCVISPARAVNIFDAENSSTDKIRFILPMVNTTEKQLNSAIQGTPDVSLSRYNKLAKLINQMIRGEVKPGYLVFPELSIPERWFPLFAQKLATSKLSFIAGIEYQKANDNGGLYNQVWASLRHDGWGFPSSFIYKHTKRNAAHGEEQNLLKQAKKNLLPDPRMNPPLIVNHNDFWFGLLVCSELSNLGAHTKMRGAVDAVIVPQWNKDQPTFESLISTAAYGVHAYIIQVNNRFYGDTRIRTPLKERWQRDLVQLKGGNDDYYVEATIDVKELREFQSQYRSANEKFKPLPDGFEMSLQRKINN